MKARTVRVMVRLHFTTGSDPIQSWNPRYDWQRFLRNARTVIADWYAAGYREFWLEIDGKRRPVEFLPRPERQLGLWQ